MIKIKKLVIEKFRAFSPDTEIHIGNNLTLIAGQNGTSKSSILGMLGQPFGIGQSTRNKSSLYTEAYNDTDLKNLKTISGDLFATEFSKVFRLSQKNDKAGDHIYKIYLDGESINKDVLPESILTVESLQREDKIRFVTNSKNRKPGAGNFPHPVIYLGLQRLQPLCLEGNLGIETNGFDESDKKYFLENYKQILVSHESMELEKIYPKKGNYYTGATSQYDSDAVSSGQDNLSQIISTILSFRRLKKQLADKYQGGLVLIDELDATLHPVSQEKLIEFLIAASSELDLQIVATTHSLFILEQINKNKKNINLIYLKKYGSQINSVTEPDYDSVYSDLTLTLKRPKKIKENKVAIWVEDKVAKDFYTSLTRKLFNNFAYVDNVDNVAGISNGFIVQCADIANKKGMNTLSNIVFILDGDSSETIGHRKYKNLLMLPGNGKCVEKMMFQFLKTLDDASPFWTIKNRGFSKQICFRDFITEPTDKNGYKQWFNSISDQGLLGRESNYLFKEWMKTNINDVNIFNLSLLDAVLSTEIGSQLNLNKKTFKKTLAYN